jgi:sacsin
VQVPFVPNGKGQLHSPSKLYDPRIPELVRLLDPDSSFPADLFVADNLALGMLQQLGLQSSASLDTVLKAAGYVAQLGQQGKEEPAVEKGKVSSANMPTP